MSWSLIRCPGCGSLLPSAGASTICGLCGAEAWPGPPEPEPEPEPAPEPPPAPTWPPPDLRPVADLAAMAARRARAMPVIERLFSRYADMIGAAALGQGTREDALPYFEAASYLILWTSYETDDLARFEPLMTPQMHEAARQLGVLYRPPRERGITLSWATVEALLAEAERS